MASISAGSGGGLVTRLRSRLPVTNRRDNIAGWLFISPVLLWILVFTAYPLISSLYLSFREWDPLFTDEYVGLANYAELMEDRIFLKAYQNALVYAAITIPLGLVWGMSVALAVQHIRGRAFFRALYFLPTVTSSVAIAIVWSFAYNQDYGLVNSLLRYVNVDGPNWLGHTQWALLSISLVVVWAGTGFWMIVFLAGLLDIPPEYYDAAKVDGATGWQSLWRITLPLMSPTIFYYITNALITVWVQFEIPFVMTGGGPANATLMPALHLYREAWDRLKMGYASAMAWVMALIIFIITALHFSLSRRWVNYDR